MAYHLPLTHPFLHLRERDSLQLSSVCTVKKKLVSQKSYISKLGTYVSNLETHVSNLGTYVSKLEKKISSVSYWVIPEPGYRKQAQGLYISLQ